MELLLLRIDHLRERKRYVGILRGWLQELALANGRLITVGDLHLLFIAADAPARNDELLEYYRSKPIDVNSREELCVDRFIDVLGRKTVDKCACKGFLEMNILNESMLRKLLVQDWHAEGSWVDAALATPRTKAFLDWREAAKAARSDRRKRSAKERTEQREAKKLKMEQEKEKEKKKQESVDTMEPDAEKPDSNAKPAEADEMEPSDAEDQEEQITAAQEDPVQQRNESSAAKKKKKRKRKSK